MSSFSHPLHPFIIRANLSCDKTFFSVQEGEVCCYLHQADGIHRVMCESHVGLYVFSPCFALLTCWQRIQEGQNQRNLCLIFLTRTLVIHLHWEEDKEENVYMLPGLYCNILLYLSHTRGIAAHQSLRNAYPPGR